MFSDSFCPVWRRLTQGGAALLLLGAAGVASAQDAVQLDVQRYGMVGQAHPSVTVTVNTPLSRLSVQLACGATKAQHQGPARSGERVKIELKVPPGKHSCAGTLQIVAEDGSEGSMPIKLEVEQLQPVKISVQRDEVDTAGRTLTLRVDRAVATVEVDAHGVSGLIGGGKAPGGPAGAPITLTWRDNGEETLRLDLKAVDPQGFTAGLQLFPWHYDVPHEDVVFESGAAAIRPSEEPKLRKALEEIQGVMAKYGAIAKVNLYVAGFTDTVGDAASNQRLSEQRARAIAGWFAANGFTQPISLRGLGENGLMVPTPDGTDEARNRRATYILAADTPPAGPTLPAGSWTPLR